MRITLNIETLHINYYDGFDDFGDLVDCVGYFGFDDCQPIVCHHLRTTIQLCSLLMMKLEVFHPLFPVVIVLPNPSATHWEFVEWLMPVQIERVVKARDLMMNPPD